MEGAGRYFRLPGRFRQDEPRSRATLRALRAVRDDHARVDAPTRARIDAILAAYEGFRCEIAETREEGIPVYARSPLLETARRMDSLALRAAELALRRSDIAHALEGVNLSEVRHRQARLRMRAERPEAREDALIAGQIAQSLAFTESEAEAYEAMQRAMRRIDGQLETLECAFAAMKARLLRLKTDGHASWESGGESLVEEAAAVSRQMDSLDEAVNETVALLGRGGSPGSSGAG